MLNVELVKSKHGPSYRVEISGKIGRIAISGSSATYFHGLDELTPSLVSQIVNIWRSDGSGRPVTTRVERVVLDEVLVLLQTL